MLGDVLFVLFTAVVFALVGWTLRGRFGTFDAMRDAVKRVVKDDE